MFRRLLIANRGEIAVRVIRTARRLGIHTIAVYSEADAGAAHVRLADEAWLLGPAPPRQSYLDAERVLDVARRCGADAIHPGYGFLSERSDFAAACRDAGIAFIGPSPASIAAMGSKSAAKEAMHRAGVPVLPGYHGADQSLERLTAEARNVGFPLIIKPSGGGGGKGMQIVATEAALAPALASAKRLADSAFGDPTLLLERYLPAPRHVEVQLLADVAGNVRCLATRDCSVQRRHQKLIEEAPAPGIPGEVRRRLNDAARAVARAVGYQSAGTVEFLYAEGEFWFMEMNTRLQVEHTVTEEVLGIDLVEWQLRIADGQSIAGWDEELEPRGHAIEVRVCAEDAAADFAPSAGRLACVDWPQQVRGVRVDAGFETGDTVSPNYDSLLGKIIAHGETRAAAISTLRRALSQLHVVGVETNASWLAGALAHPAFGDATPTTRFVADHGAPLAATPAVTAREFALAAIAAVTLRADRRDRRSPWDVSDSFRAGLPCRETIKLGAAGAEHAVTVEHRHGGLRVDALDETVDATASATGDGIAAVIAGRRSEHRVVVVGDTLSIWRGATRLDFSIVDPRHADVRAHAHEGELTAKLPGTVVSVAVAVDEIVEPGAVLMVVEAMKMEHAVLAPYAGRVAAIHHRTGDRVTEGAVLVELIPQEGSQTVGE